MGEAKRRKELGLTHSDRMPDMSPEVRAIFEKYKDLRTGKYAKQSKAKNKLMPPLEPIIRKYSMDKESFARMIFEPKQPMIDSEPKHRPEAVYVGGDRGQKMVLVTAKYTTYSMVYHDSHGHDIYPEGCMTAGPWYLPDRAEKIVTSVLGEEAYLEWKALVKGDMELLRELVWSDEFTWRGVSFSAISCYRSKLLCEWMGFEVQQGISFHVRK